MILPEGYRKLLAKAGILPTSADAPTTGNALPVTRDPVTFEMWPTWAKMIYDMRDPVDAGVGSTIKRLLGDGGSAIEMMLAAAGVQCKCDARRARFDQLYPYTTTV